MKKNDEDNILIPFPPGWDYNELLREACDPNTYRTGVYVDRGLAIQVANVAVTNLWSREVITERQCLQITDAIRQAIEKAQALPPVPSSQEIDKIRARVDKHTGSCSYDSTDGPDGDYCSCGKREARESFERLVSSVAPTIK